MMTSVTLTLSLKLYKGGVIERFPDGGKMSQYFGTLKVGDSVTLSGPFGLVEYKGEGLFTWKGKSFKCTQVGMIAWRNWYYSLCSK